MEALERLGDQTTEAQRDRELDPLALLLANRSAPSPCAAPAGLLVGELIGMTDDGRTPLVIYPGQAGTAAIAARAILDLHGAHVGKPVVLFFDGNDPAQPVVLGVIRSSTACSFDRTTGQVDVDADGERLTVTAKEQLVLRCGKASITLTKAGKVLLQGTYISSRSSGINRVKGGSVHIN